MHSILFYFVLAEFHQTNSPVSRPISPWSISSSSDGNLLILLIYVYNFIINLFTVGQLELESTCSSLIWGSVPSNTKYIQTFMLRNRGSHKEKLLLSIKDNRNCFKVRYNVYYL